MIESLNPWRPAPSTPAPVPAFIRQLSERLHEQVPTASDKAWAQMPTPYKKTILRAAGLDPLREQMPWKTFNRDDRVAIKLAIQRLERLNRQLMELLK